VDNATIARSYATALFELAAKSGSAEAFSRGLGDVRALLAADGRIGDFLRSPKIDVEAKKTALRAAFDGRVPPLFLNFLMVVLDKRRQRLLGEIGREFDLLMDQQLGRVNVQVTLAHEPDADELADIRARLARLIGKDVITHVHQDSEILGGIIVRYGDRLLDGSLRRQLLSLRGRLMEASIAAQAPGTNQG